ncbi:hypothetical protein J6590_007676 [Homalodisca vitripennis]|nr:hypothetical protein J6590_007676 [Homalodisca vitripennis]
MSTPTLNPKVTGDMPNYNIHSQSANGRTLKGSLQLKLVALCNCLLWLVIKTDPDYSLSSKCDTNACVTAL